MAVQSVLQSKASIVDTDSGVAHKDREILAEKLSSSLADSYLLYLKTQNVHWNIVGPLFYSVHKLTEGQYSEMADAIDTIAERIRAIGFIAPGSFEAFKKITAIKENSDVKDADTMIKELVADNEQCVRSLRDAVIEAENVDDVKTADLLTERIGVHEENAWMLRAMVS